MSSGRACGGSPGVMSARSNPRATSSHAASLGVLSSMDPVVQAAARRLGRPSSQYAAAAATASSSARSLSCVPTWPRTQCQRTVR